MASVDYRATRCGLCYPWTSGSGLAVELSRGASYRTNHWGKVDNRLANQPGDDPYHISRMASDSFYLLPGARRESLRNVLWRKVCRGTRTGSPYLSD